jgi:hypothetical protein
MKTFLLKRVSYDTDGSYGVLIRDDGFPWLLTLEDEQKQNRRGVSAIPEGTYVVLRTATPKHGECFMVMNVPDRSAILIHSGNTEKDTEGCILLGKEFGTITGRDEDSGAVEKQTAVLRSKEAIKEFMAYLEGEGAFSLRIVNV